MFTVSNKCPCLWNKYYISDSDSDAGEDVKWFALEFFLSLTEITEVIGCKIQ